MTSRKQQQADLIFKFGVLIGPLLEIANNLLNTQLKPLKTRAKYMSDISIFKEQVQNFTNGEEGYLYEIERQKIQGEINSFFPITH